MQQGKETGIAHLLSSPPRYMSYLRFPAPRATFRPTINKAPTDIVVPLKEAHGEFLAFLIRDLEKVAGVPEPRVDKDLQTTSGDALANVTLGYWNVSEFQSATVRNFRVYSARLSRMVTFLGDYGVLVVKREDFLILNIVFTSGMVPFWP